MSRDGNRKTRRYWTRDSVILSVRIPRELKARLRRLAREARQSLNRFVAARLDAEK